MKKRLSRCLKSFVDGSQTVIATILTWVTFICLPVSVCYAIYYIFWDFSLSRAIAGLALAVVSVYVNVHL